MRASGISSQWIRCRDREWPTATVLWLTDHWVDGFWRYNKDYFVSMIELFGEIVKYLLSCNLWTSVWIVRSLLPERGAWLISAAGDSVWFCNQTVSRWLFCYTKESPDLDNNLPISLIILSEVIVFPAWETKGAQLNSVCSWHDRFALGFALRMWADLSCIKHLFKCTCTALP